MSTYNHMFSELPPCDDPQKKEDGDCSDDGEHSDENGFFSDVTDDSGVELNITSTEVTDEWEKVKSSVEKKYAYIL